MQKNQAKQAVKLPANQQDALSLERLQKLITLETAVEARQQIVDWGKWVVGGFVALLTLLGITTYAELTSKIDKISDDAARRVNEETDTALKKMHADVETAKLSLTSDLEKEVNQVKQLISEKRIETIVYFETVRGSVAPYITKNAGLAIFREIYVAGVGRTEKLSRSEGGPAAGDEAVDNLYDYLGICHEFFAVNFGMASYDGKGEKLNGVVHYGTKYNNSFWDGKRLVFGDGDGVLFGSLVDLGIVAYEYSRIVIDKSAKFTYENQSGALSNHFQDVFSTLIVQWHGHQTVDQADWLIGAKVFTPKTDGDALRSMKAPGTAYDNGTMGKDPQPDHMSKFVVLPNTGEGDWGGVHVNSGIPNRAFYLAAKKIGGFAWEKTGKIWYVSLKSLAPDSDFEDAARVTVAQASNLFGAESDEKKAVEDAWAEVGVVVKQ